MSDTFSMNIKHLTNKENPYEDKLVVNRLVFEGSRDDVAAVYQLLAIDNSHFGSVLLNNVVPTPSYEHFERDYGSVRAWRFQEWGADREVYSLTSPEDIKPKSKRGVIFFLSYLNAPKKVIKVLAEMFPNVVFLYSFAASTTEYGEVVLYNKGKVEAHNTFFKGSRVWNSVLKKFYGKGNVPDYFLS